MNISPELRVMIALARSNPSPEMVRCAREVVSSGIDWRRLCALCVRNRVSGLVWQSVSTLLGDIAPVGHLDDMRAAAMRSRAMSMAFLATQINIVDRFLTPLRIRHAFLKGAVISVRHYGDPILRAVSDLDVLVESTRIPELVERMVEQGWRIASPFWKGQELSLFTRLVSVVELVAPDGRRVEVHRLVDGSGLVFDSQALLSKVVTCCIAGRSVCALAPVDEIRVILHHHSRHGWSCYHWVADIVSMMNSSTSINRCVESLCHDSFLGPTVSAVLMLVKNIDALAVSGKLQGNAEVSPFLHDCIASIDRLDAPLSSVMNVDAAAKEPDFPNRWQRTLKYKLMFFWGRFRPNLNDLDFIQLPSSVSWMYWIIRPLRVIYTRIGAFGTRK